MAFPNLIALIMLRKVIWSDTKDYFKNLRMKRLKDQEERNQNEQAPA